MQPVRVAVTGVGLVTPLGWGREHTWRGLYQGISAVQWLDFPGEEAHGLELPVHQARILDSHQVGSVRLRRTTWFGAPGRVPDLSKSDCGSCGFMAHFAALEALMHARLPLGSSEVRDAGIVLGASKPDLHWVDQSWRTEGDFFGEFLWHSLQPAAITHEVVQCVNSRGPLLCPVAACATGLVSIIRGANLIREGACSTVIAGSADAALHPGLLASYKRLGVLADPGDDPATCCRPFDVDRRGFAVGEGAGVLVLEDWKQALRRGAKPLAEWIDGGIASDPTGLTTINESGEPLAELVRRVLDRAQIHPRDVDAVQVHGTATPMNDEAEAAALRAVFRRVPRQPLGWGLKGAIGHLMGAAGSVESAACVLALQHGEWPATVNHEHPLPECPLEFRRSSSAQRPLRTVLKLSLGFGGHLAAGIWRRVDMD